MTEGPLLLTPEEVADLLQVTPADVLKLIQEGYISGMPIAGHWRVRVDSVKEFLREGLQRVTQRTGQESRATFPTWLQPSSRQSIRGTAGST